VFFVLPSRSSSPIHLCISDLSSIPPGSFLRIFAVVSSFSRFLMISSF